MWCPCGSTGFGSHEIDKNGTDAEALKDMVMITLYQDISAYGGIVSIFKMKIQDVERQEEMPQVVHEAIIAELMPEMSDVKGMQKEKELLVGTNDQLAQKPTASEGSEGKMAIQLMFTLLQYNNIELSVELRILASCLQMVAEVHLYRQGTC